MRKLALLCAIGLGAALILAASGNYQPLKVKTGLWETTWSSEVSGRPPIPADMLQNMTPEQRAKLEAAMGKMASQAPEGRTNKSCLTKEKLEKDPFKQDNKSCTQTVLASTGSKMQIHEVCGNEYGKMDMIVDIEATDSEHVKGTVKSNTSGGGNSMNVNGTFNSKWLGAACGDTK